VGAWFSLVEANTGYRQKVMPVEPSLPEYSHAGSSNLPVHENSCTIHANSTGISTVRFTNNPKA
jgi:hypothetical protein